MAHPKTKTPASKLADLVVYQRAEGGSIWTLPTNPGYEEPSEIDPARGIAPESVDARRGEQAITARVLHDLVPARLREWIGARLKRHGGMGMLTDQLLAMRHLPPTPVKYRDDPEKYRKNYRKALIRALRRSGPAGRKPAREEEHGGIKQPEYRLRIALLVLHDLPVALAVYGLWHVEGDRRGAHHSWFYSDPYDPEQALLCRDILSQDGIGFIDLVEGIAQGIIGGSRTITLETINALKVETRD